MTQPETATGRRAEVEVICTGDAWEMGFAQGQALKAKIHSALSILTGLEVFRLQKPKWMPFRAYHALAERKAQKFLTTGLDGVLPGAQTRLNGIAAGADVRPKSLFLLNSLEAVLSDLSQSSVVPIAAACSAVAVTGRSSSTGQPILAHNFDYLPVVQSLYTLRESRPAGKLRSLEFFAAPLSGAVDGMNEAGLCITYNYAYTIDGGQPGPTISMWIAEALGRFRTVPPAAQFLANAKRWGGGLLMLGDAQGNIVSLELSNSQSALRPPPGGTDRLFHTNRFQIATMTPVEVDSSAIYSHRAPRALRQIRVHQSAEARADRIREHLGRLNQLDAEEIERLMSDHGPQDEPTADTICMHGDYWHTTACVRLFPSQRRMRVAYNSACCAEFADVQL